MTSEELASFGLAVEQLNPKDALQFLHDHHLSLADVADAAGLGRQSAYNWANKGTSPSLKNWRAFQRALHFVAHDPDLLPRRRALRMDPALAHDLRWLAELAVQRGDLSEISAARLLGLDFEQWNALPPMEEQK